MENQNTKPINEKDPHHLRTTLQYAHFLTGKTLLDEYIRAGLTLEEAVGLVYQQGVSVGVQLGAESVKEQCSGAIARERRKFKERLEAQQQTQKPRTFHEAIEQRIMQQRAEADAAGAPLEHGCSNNAESTGETEAQQHE